MTNYPDFIASWVKNQNDQFIFNKTLSGCIMETNTERFKKILIIAFLIGIFLLIFGIWSGSNLNSLGWVVLILFIIGVVYYFVFIRR